MTDDHPKIRAMEAVRDWESIAVKAYEEGHITKEEKHEYIRIEEKIWDARIEDMKEEVDG